ncbi:MAG: aspartate kinase [Firmicutes bacterium]|nr:aspartate kinase [Bacillota bacterium]
MVKVVKFGGSSLADAGQFRKVAQIVKEDPSRAYVVPSAPGKRCKTDTKVTDLLIQCHNTAHFGDDWRPILGRIKERYEEIRHDLGLNARLEDEFTVIEEHLRKGCSLDYMASRGEYLNGILLAEYLGYEFVDAAEVVLFGEDGKYDAADAVRKMRERLGDRKRVVIPGFYGAKPDGSIKTFSRGGSDITGAIVAQAVNADLYENWTDVSGFLMCDPNIVEDPRPIRVITYRELRELSYMGASVLHSESIFPVKDAGIPINIRNTNEPEAPGTMIVAHAPADPEGDIITGIAGRKGFVVIRIEKDMMNQEVGFGLKVLKVLKDFNISFEHLPSGIDTMCVVLNSKEVAGRENDLLSALTQAVCPDYIVMDRGLALIAVVGRGMRSQTGTASRVFSAVAEGGVNISMIDQGSSELNIILGIREEDFEKTIRNIYHAFY